MPRGLVWSRVPLAQGHAFDLAGTEALPKDVEAHARAVMLAEDCDLIATVDPGRDV